MFKSIIIALAIFSSGCATLLYPSLQMRREANRICKEQRSTQAVRDYLSDYYHWNVNSEEIARLLEAYPSGTCEVSR